MNNAGHHETSVADGIALLGLAWDCLTEVVNTHILCDPAAADVKLFQAHLLLKVRFCDEFSAMSGIMLFLPSWQNITMFLIFPKNPGMS